MEKRPRDLAASDQQPIGRVVGRRSQAPIGILPSAEARAAMTANANYRTRVPKGIFSYASDKRYALRINDEFTVDIMPSIAGHSWEEMRAYIETLDLDGVPLKVLNLEGLLLTKQGARPKDQMDAALIREALAALDSGQK